MLQRWMIFVIVFIRQIRIIILLARLIVMLLFMAETAENVGKFFLAIVPHLYADFSLMMAIILKVCWNMIWIHVSHILTLRAFPFLEYTRLSLTSALEKGIEAFANFRPQMCIWLHEFMRIIAWTLLKVFFSSHYCLHRLIKAALVTTSLFSRIICTIFNVLFVCRYLFLREVKLIRWIEIFQLRFLKLLWSFNFFDAPLDVTHGIIIFGLSLQTIDFKLLMRCKCVKNLTWLSCLYLDSEICCEKLSPSRF